MKDVSNKSIGMTHDGYLKLYQMSGPRLDSCDIILIDEAQDLTPGTCASVFVFSSIKQCIDVIAHYNSNMGFKF